MKAHVHSLRESLKSNDFVLTGRTTDGWKVKVYALQCPYNAAKSEGEDVEIAFTPDLVEFTKSLPYKKPSEDKKFSYGLAYLGPISEFIWTENSTVETTRFGFTTFAGNRDWLSMEIDETKFLLFQNDTGGASLHIKTPECSIEELEKCFDSFINALSLLLGRYVAPYCKDLVVGKNQTLMLVPEPRRNKRSRSALPPILHDGGVKEIDFLTCAYRFFKEESNKPLIWYLRMLWTGDESIWEINRATAGICVELLASYIVKENLQITGPVHMREVIQQAGREFGIKIFAKETEAWSEIRNGSCHWRGRNFKLKDEFQKYLCCVTLLHKLSAGLIGWKGTLIDFTAPDRRSMSFPYETHISMPPAQNNQGLQKPRRRGLKQQTPPKP
jgi:hypothetical protein